MIAVSRQSFAAISGRIDPQVVTTVMVRLLIVAGGFVSSVITARALSPAGRGQYFLVITLAQMMSQFGNFGLQSSNTYLVARNRALAGSLVANSLWIALAAGGLGSVLVILIRQATAGAVDSRLWFVAVLAPATLFYMLGGNILVGLQQFRLFNLFQLAGNYGVLFCLVTAAVLGAGPGGFLAASTCGWAVVSLLLLAAIRREVPQSLHFNRAVFRDGLRYSGKVYATTLCGFLVVRSNVFLLNSLHGSEDVGFYSVASQMADIMAILPQSIALVLFPTLIAATHGRFRTTMRQMAGVGVALAAGCVVIGLLAEPFVGILFGPKFIPTVPLLRWMLPGVFFLGLTSVLSQYLAAAGFPAALVGIWIGAAAMSAGLGWWLVPGGAGAGAAIALSLTHAAVFAAVLWLSYVVARRAIPVARPAPLAEETEPALLAEGMVS